jgi:hypothetical protein
MPTASKLITEVEINCHLDYYRPKTILTNRAPIVGVFSVAHPLGNERLYRHVGSHTSFGRRRFGRKNDPDSPRKVRCVIISGRENWTEYLSAIQEAINNTPPESTLVTPNQACNSYDHLEIARRNLIKYQREMIEKCNLNRWAEEFTLYDHMWVDTCYDQKNYSKLSERFRDLYFIKKKYHQRHMNLTCKQVTETHNQCTTLNC